MTRSPRSALSRPRWLATLVRVLPLVMLVTSCGLFDSRLDDLREEMDAARHRWRALRLTDYEMVQQKGCFCGPEYIQLMRVEVRGGSVVRVESVSGDSLLPLFMGMTVDDFFYRIDQAIEHEFRHIDVSYHATMGYPLHLALDPGGGVTDAGFSASIPWLAALDAIAFCDENGRPAEPCPAPGGGEHPYLYEYVSYDSAGALVDKGVLGLDFTPSAGEGRWRVSGHRCTVVNCASGAVGPHAGSYDVAGDVTGGSLSLDLNAGWADSNILFNGRFDHGLFDDFDGTWQYLSFHGLTDHGTFLARRVG